MILKKLIKPYIWKRIFLERFTAPIHHNILSLFVLLFGTYRQKINFDLVVRQQHAFSILKCAELAKKQGYSAVTLIEFGCANGAGLLNMAKISKKVSAITGISFHILGFDTGTGLPSPIDYRDTFNGFQEGEYQMNVNKLKTNLPSNVSLILGDIKDTIQNLSNTLSKDAPVGYVVIDVDYYSSTKDALRLFDYDPAYFLPSLLVYLDDIGEFGHSRFCGEELAIDEFNTEHPLIKIEPYSFLNFERLFNHSKWVKKIFKCHFYDHPITKKKKKMVHLENPYL